MTTLAVWLGNEHLADIEQVGSGELRLRYLQAAFDRYGQGSIALSIALPVEPRHRGTAVTRWVESMLPEGETRTSLEDRFGVRRGDSFGLLTAIGADCAGAVAFLEPGTEPVNQLGSTQRLDEAAVARAIAALPQQPLGADEDVRVSLGGLQAKLLLTQMPDGSWARPADGTPSTHIAKPDPLAHPGLVVDEAFSLALAEAAGFRVPQFTLQTDWVDRPVLVLRRYDRLVADGRVSRIHQEDGAAALGLNPTGRRKYQSQDHASPSLKKIAALLRQHGQRFMTDFASLGRDITLRVAVGDTDGHVRNYSFLHTGDVIEMAPIYDVAPTYLHVSSKQLGLYVQGQPYLAHITLRHLAGEIESWGVPKAAAADLAESSLRQLAAAIPVAVQRVPEVSDRTVSSTADRIDRLLGIASS